MLKRVDDQGFQPINRGYNTVFRPNRLSLGVVVPLETYSTGPVPSMTRHVERVQLAEELGFSAIWLRDVPFNVPSFGDAGQIFDPFVYLGLLAARTERIALGVASIVLPLRHPAHVAKAAASVDVLSGGRLILGVASGDRPEKYPALNLPFAERGARFRASFDYIKRMWEDSPAFENTYGSSYGGMDMLPKPASGKMPLLITGSTDGIGLATARMLVSLGHHVLLHGRNPTKLESAEETLSALPGGGRVESYVADLSRMADVETLAKAVAERHAKLDVLINNAGVFRTRDTITQDGLDVRFAVNTIAPYLLTQRLLPLLAASGRVVNQSSAAQSPVDPEALVGRFGLSDMAAYSQSKLALTMWSRSIALSHKDEGPAIIAVNPGLMLGTKMVKEGFGVAGGDIRIGTEILTSAALADEFESASGQYFDNDSGQFASPHPDALDPRKSEEIVRVIEAVLVEISQSDENHL